MSKQQDEKRILRNALKQIDNQISLEQKVIWSEDITKQIEAQPNFIEARVVLLFYALNDEPSMAHLLNKWSRQKTLLLPKVIDDKHMELRIYSNESDLEMGKYNIMEPKGNIFNNYKNIDLAIIPGTAFDSCGNRMGRGKGYYDRFLSSESTKGIYKIGVCFPFRYLKSIPAEEHDSLMDFVITAKESILKAANFQIDGI